MFLTSQNIFKCIRMENGLISIFLFCKFLSSKKLFGKLQYCGMLFLNLEMFVTYLFDTIFF